MLTESERKRYERQIMISEIGHEGRERLDRAREGLTGGSGLHSGNGGNKIYRGNW